MGVSSHWDELYRNGLHLSQWPWSDLVSLTMRHGGVEVNHKVLELGCGAGANIPFFKHLKVDYYSVEGSQFIVDRVKRDHPNCAPNIRCGDLCENIPFKESFDLVVDRFAVACNAYAKIRDCVRKVTPRMKEGALFIGVDWRSTESDYSEQGDRGEDGVTCANYESGPFRDMGAFILLTRRECSSYSRHLKWCSWNTRRALMRIRLVEVSNIVPGMSS